MPTTTEGILETGADITFEQVESLFAAEVKSASHTPSIGRVRASRSDISMLSTWPAEDLELSLAEVYPRYRWNFPWREFTIVGVPDGITVEMVYEFKAAGNEYWFSTASRPVGTTQADLYGMFFARPRKRVQIFIRETGQTETIDSEVDEGRATQTLERFRAVEQGALPRPPKPFKCRPCEVREGCPIRQDR